MLLFRYTTYLYGSYYSQPPLSLKNIVTILINNLKILPEGSHVILNTGGIGKVISVNKNLSTRPVVKIIQNENGKPLNQPYTVNLLENENMSVVSMLN